MWGVQTYTHYIYIYQNNPINFVEIKFSSKIHVDTMKMEHKVGVYVAVPITYLDMQLQLLPFDAL